MSFYTLDLESIKNIIKTSDPTPQKIMLQFPDGLLGQPLQQVVDLLKEYGVQSIIAADPSYGACDLPTQQADLLHIDMIFHFGHSTYAFPPPKGFKSRIHYFPVDAVFEIPWTTIGTKITALGWKNVGLLTTIQHIKLLSQAKQILSPMGIEVYQHYEGQILGCNQDRAVKINSFVDGFLVIAGGDFHASPVVVATGKPTLRYDPFNGSFNLFDLNYRDKYLARRYAMIEKAHHAKRWGVLLSGKSGQLPRDHGQRIINMLTQAGYEATPFIMYRIYANHLLNFETIDAWVITLCPRIATDDYVLFNKPILTTRELAELLGDLTWDHFISPKIQEHLLTIEPFATE